MIGIIFTPTVTEWLISERGGGHNIQDVKIDTAQIQPADRTLLAATFAEAALRFYQVAEHQEQYQQWSQQQGVLQIKVKP